jgi:hypothetical protein
LKTKRTWIVVWLMLLALPTLTSCGKDKYADAREIMTAHADVMEAYITGLEKAASPSDCAAVIDAYTEGMAKLIPRLKTFRETYPDLAREGSQDEIPPEIAQQAKRLEELGNRMPAATMNMMKYMADPEVQAAMERMTQTMQKIDG